MSTGIIIKNMEDVRQEIARFEIKTAKIQDRRKQ